MDTRALTVSFQAGPIESLDIVGLSVERRLGKVAAATVELRTATYAEPDELLGLPARVAFGRGEAEHDLVGVVMSVSLITSPEDDAREHLAYRFHLTSCLGLLTRSVDCAIFQDKDVKEIVSEVLRDHGITDAMQSWRLTAEYPKREYCVQYNESALAFISRLLEEEGIFFFSEVGDSGELVVFEDDSTLADPIDGEKTIPYRHGAGLDAADDAIGVIHQRVRTASGKVTFRDYDFKRPELDLTATATADAATDLEIYDYPGHYTEPEQGSRLAQVRLESIQAVRQTLDLESGCARLVAGRWITLVETPWDIDGDYLITGVVHELRAGAYRVHAEVIPKKTKFRTPQNTPSPILDGPQTAMIVAPPGSPPEEIHTDEHGRCKVQFHWNYSMPQTSAGIVTPSSASNPADSRRCRPPPRPFDGSDRRRLRRRLPPARPEAPNRLRSRCTPAPPPQPLQH